MNTFEPGETVISIHWEKVGRVINHTDDGFVMIEWLCLEGMTFPIRPEHLKRHKVTNG